MKKYQDLLFFYASRFLGLALKPLALWCALNFGTESWREFFAKLFFVVPATFIAFNIDGHIQYYKDRFGADSSAAKTSFSFRTYLLHLLSHVAIFSVPLFACFVFYFGNFFLAAAFLILAIHEKLFDEVLRYQLFAKRYDLWASAFFMKAALPLTALGFSLLTGYALPSVTLVVLTVSLSVVVLWQLTTKPVRRLMLRTLGVTLKGRAFSYFRAYRKKYVVNQLASLCAYNLLAVDKWVGGTRWSARTLTEVVLATQFGSMYLVLVDNLFFTVNRDRYVKQGATRGQVVNWTGLIGLTVAVLFAFGVGLSFFKIPFGFLDLSVPVILAIFLVSVLKGFARPLEEYVFWHRPRSAALAIDALCILSMYLLARFLFSFSNTLPLYLGILGVLILRMVLYFALADRTEERTLGIGLHDAG